MPSFNEALKAGKVTVDEANAIFDSLEPIPIEFLIGTWKGSGFATGHPMDGSLESSGWYGKRFKDLNSVDPLLFTSKSGDIFPGNPVKCMALVGSEKKVVDHQSEVESTVPNARLRLVEYRGRVSASMVYNEIPVIDMFRKVDEDTVLGTMDNISLPGPPYFFVLRRQK